MPKYLENLGHYFFNCFFRTKLFLIAFWDSDNTNIKPVFIVLQVSEMGFFF